MKILLSLLLIILIAANSSAQLAAVIAENANLRGTPNAAGRVVDTVSQGTALEVIKQRGAWFLVQTEDYAGWLHGDTIRLADSADPGNYIYVPRVAPASAARTTEPPTATIPPRRSNTRTYIRGPRGGCYYFNSNGNKTYVDRGMCG